MNNEEELTYADFLEVFKAISTDLSLIEEHNAEIVKKLTSIDKKLWNTL